MTDYIAPENILDNMFSPESGRIQPLNEPLLRKAVEWASAEAELLESHGWDEDVVRDDEYKDMTWNQQYWNMGVFDENATRCGTTYCIAGWVGQHLDERYREDTRVAGVHVRDFAQVNLGLTYVEAESLFSGGNNIEAVQRIAYEIIRGVFPE